MLRFVWLWSLSELVDCDVAMDGIYAGLRDKRWCDSNM